MALKLWKVDEGRIISLMHVNSKNESRLVKLKESIDCDNVKMLSDLDNAIELMTTFVISVKKFDNLWKGEIVEERQPDNVAKDDTVGEEKLSNVGRDEIVIEKDEATWAWGNDHDNNGERKDIPEEEKDKLNALLEKDIGKPCGAQYLIHKNARTDADKGKNHLSGPIHGRADHVDSEQKDGTVRGKGGEDKKESKDKKIGNGGRGRSKYEGVILELLPEILDGIENSKDKTVTMKVSAILARMEGISVSKSPGNVYTGLRLRLFSHNIVADQISIGEPDAITHRKEKALVMRTREESDRLPAYILRNRSKKPAGQ